MKTGIFCTYENHHQYAHRAIEEQVTLVQHAETIAKTHPDLKPRTDKSALALSHKKQGVKQRL